MKIFIYLLTLFTALTLNAQTKYVIGDQWKSSNLSRTFIPPASSDNLVGRVSTDILQNKTISGVNNALLNIPHSSMVDLVSSRLLISNISGDVSVSPVTSTEAGYLSGTTSSIQTQFDNLVNQVNALISDSIPIGLISPYAGSTIPSGYLYCDGRRVSRTTYANLFSVIGTKFGNGDGSTTFNLPDLRGVFARGVMEIPNKLCSGSSSSNNVTATGHSYNRSGIPVIVTGTPVTGLNLNTTYWLIYVDDNTVAFATTESNALASTKITISGSAASMTIIQYQDPDASNRTQMTAGASASGDNTGSMQADAFQGHFHNSFGTSGGGFNTGLLGPSQTTSSSNYLTAGPVSDGTNGTPRTASETRPKNIALKYIIKY